MITFEWNRQGRTFDLDGNSSSNSLELDVAPLGYFTDAYFAVGNPHLGGWDVTNVDTYTWRIERTQTEGLFLIEQGFVHIEERRWTRDVSGEVFEERYAICQVGATGCPIEEDFTDWQVVATRPYPEFVPLTHMRLTIEFVSGVTNLGSGKHEISIVAIPPNGPTTTHYLGTTSVRMIRIENLKVDCPFDPLEEKGHIEFDLYAYPRGWVPSSPMDWEVDIRNGNGTETRSGSSNPFTAQEPDGRVDFVNFEWNGKIANEFVKADVLLDGRIITPPSTTGNTVSERLNQPGTVFHRLCCTEAHQQEAVVQWPISFGGAGPLSVLVYVYKSLDSCRAPASPGYGWSSNIGSARVTEPEPGVVVYRSEQGMTMRWTDDGTGNYLPEREDNYVELEVNPTSTPAFLLRYRDQSEREFDSTGRLVLERDRNNNTVSYTYSGSNLTQVSDSKGHSLHFDYGSRTDGQPVEIRANDPVTGRAALFEYYPSSHPISSNRLSKITNPIGDVTEFEYSTRGQLSKQIMRRPTLGDLEINYVHTKEGRLYTETIYGVLQRTHSRDPYVGPFVSTAPLLPSGDPDPENCRTQSWMQDIFGRVYSTFINENQLIIF